MGTSRMTIKGQVTIPKPIRERLGLHPGDAVEFEEEPGGIRLKKLVSRGAVIGIGDGFRLVSARTGPLRKLLKRLPPPPPGS